jgi:OmpA-OmpF porin, OOP family
MRYHTRLEADMRGWWRRTVPWLVALVTACAAPPVQELALVDMVPAGDIDPTREAPVRRVYFDPNSAALTPEAMATLDEIVADPARSTWKQIVLAGHTDRVGSERGNVRLSASRAEAVRRYLVDAGVPATIIAEAVRGEREQLVETPDGTAEPQNRRVELYIRDR